MKTVSEIFDAIGGSSAMARVLDVKTSAASEMRRRGSIPVKYWPALIAHAATEKLEIDSDVLMNAHAEPAK